MERFKIDSDRAFDVLRRYSQATNVKLAVIAQQVVDLQALRIRTVFDPPGALRIYATCRSSVQRWRHGDRDPAGARLRRRAHDGRPQAAGRERLLVPQLSHPVQGEPRARRARRAASGSRSCCERTRRPACSPTTVTRSWGGRRCIRAPTPASPATARSRTSTTSTSGRCGASGYARDTAARASRHALVAGAVDFARANGAPAVEAYPVDNGDRKVDLTMAYVGTRKLFERAGFAVGRRHRLGGQRLPARADAARPALTGQAGAAMLMPPRSSSSRFLTKRPSPASATVRTRCSQLSAEFTGTKLALESWSITIP